MTKLNHERPSLRYLDNIRRELRHMAVGATAGVFPPSNYLDQVEDVLLAQASKPKMPSLTRDESNLALALLEKLGSYIEASSEMIASLMPAKKGKAKSGKAKELLDNAEKELLTACRKFCVELIISGVKGRTNLQDWYRFLGEAFAENDDSGVGTSWEMLNWAMEKAGKAVVAAAEKILREANDGLVAKWGQLR